ncbi:MAG TPA: efflux RND transporter periplasmic adaptor subunit [Kofleriaceae bacterium]|nr:efflux RND transporter periplasmic adaptor subunit [Kofleriaceae bacterium]
MPDDAPPGGGAGRDAPAPPPGTPRRRRRWVVIGLALVAVGAAFAFGALPRIRARSQVRDETDELAIPTVSVTHPERATPDQELVLPGNVVAYGDTPLFARTSGYVERWNVDIGARVKQGQLLAVIATPEIDQQVQQARSTLAVGQANLRLAQETAQRFIELRATRAVSQQDVDNAVGALRANQATVRAEQATLRQLEQLQAFEQVRAPFDGIITVRNIDVGDLINAGASATPGTELFHIVQSDKLRVYVNVPEPSSQVTQPGLAADLTFAILPTRRFTGTLVRTANAIDPATRTLRIEILVHNPTGILFAGAYTQVHFKVPIGRDAFLIPVAALLFRREGLHVATVSNGKVVMKAVTPGHDLGDRIEIVHGLTAEDAVVMNPPDSITTGEQVQIASPVRPPY